MAKMGYTKRERPRVKLECLLLLARLELDPNKQRLIGRFVETYLGLDETEQREYNQLMEAIPLTDKQAVTEVLTYWERLGLEKGLQEGREKGREEGREEGRASMRNVLLTLIETRFSSVPAEDRHLLDDLTLEALEQISAAAVTASSYDAIRALLHTAGGARDDGDT